MACALRSEYHPHPLTLESSAPCSSCCCCRREALPDDVAALDAASLLVSQDDAEAGDARLQVRDVRAHVLRGEDARL